MRTSSAVIEIGAKRGSSARRALAVLRSHGTAVESVGVVEGKAVVVIVPTGEVGGPEVFVAVVAVDVGDVVVGEVVDVEVDVTVAVPAVEVEGTNVENVVAVVPGNEVGAADFEDTDNEGVIVER